jgi:hypothetical protein
MKSKGPRGYKFRNQEKKIKWICHTLRKEDGEVPKAALLWNPQGSRKRGRHKTSWRRSVTKVVGRSWNELRFLAADRSGKAHRQPMFLGEQRTLLLLWQKVITYYLEIYLSSTGVCPFEGPIWNMAVKSLHAADYFAHFALLFVSFCSNTQWHTRLLLQMF